MEDNKTIFYSKKCDGKRGGHTVEELKVICRSLGLKVSGTKEFLCNQLAEYFEKKNGQTNNFKSSPKIQSSSSSSIKKSQPSQFSSANKVKFDNLPVEIVLNILESLSYDDLLSISKSSQRYADICKKYKLLEKAQEREIRPEVAKLANIYGWKNVKREYRKELNSYEIDKAMEDNGWDLMKFILSDKELKYIMENYTIDYDIDFLLSVNRINPNLRKEIYSWALNNDTEKINKFWNYIKPIIYENKQFKAWFKRHFIN